MLFIEYLNRFRLRHLGRRSELNLSPIEWKGAESPRSPLGFRYDSGFSGRASNPLSSLGCTYASNISVDPDGRGPAHPQPMDVYGLMTGALLGLTWWYRDQL